MIVCYFAEQEWKIYKSSNTFYLCMSKLWDKLFFSKAVAEDKKREILNFLGVPEIKEYEKYLGLLAMVGRKKKASLNYIKERV